MPIIIRQIFCKKTKITPWFFIDSDRKNSLDIIPYTKFILRVKTV